MDDPGFETLSEGGIPVQLPSGATHFVLTAQEETYLRDKIARYLGDNHFANVSDLLDVDKLVVGELLSHRWTLWVTKQRDYWDDEVPVKQLTDMVNDVQREMRQLKKALGLDKLTREKQHGDASIPAFWDDLRRRAKEFGVSRNEQFYAVLDGFKRMEAMLVWYEKCDEQERLENHCQIEDVVEVFRQEVAKFNAIDEKFRHETQRMWIRAM
jgi:hypothetical protein